MSKDMHISSGEDYYENMTKDSGHKDHPEKAKPEEGKCFYENGIKYKLVFDSEIRAWVKEVVSETKKKNEGIY